jgi:hypothetical protein
MAQKKLHGARPRRALKAPAERRGFEATDENYRALVCKFG